jgi:hypothetical protein
MESSMNSFQAWAVAYATPFGFLVMARGNWVELHKDGQIIECMSRAGVYAACAFEKV